MQFDRHSRTNQDFTHFFTESPDELRTEVRSSAVMHDAGPTWVLCYKDIRVLTFADNLELGSVLNKKYLPLGLGEDISTSGLRVWLRNRVTPPTRKNVDRMCDAQGNGYTTDGCVQLMLELGSVSINDCYWVCREHEQISWSDVSPFGVRRVKPGKSDKLTGLFQISSHFALTREEQALLFDEGVAVLRRFSPEITLQGNFPKCLHRDTAGYKLLKDNGDEPGSSAEVEVSQLAVALGLPAIEYSQLEVGKEVVCSVCSICSIECSEDCQWISAREFGSDKIAEMFSDEYNRMRTFDFIVGNPDRHKLNWGVVVDSELQPLGMIPLFDFNMALCSIGMKIPDPVDWDLVLQVEKYLTNTSATPNKQFYESRIALLRG